jgi:putative hemolysin
MQPLKNPLIDAQDNVIVRSVKNALFVILGIKKTQAANENLRTDFDQSLSELLKKRGLQVELNDQEVSKLDKAKPTLVVINHPHGILDAFLSVHFVSKCVGQNYLGFANKILKEVIFLPVDKIVAVDNQSKEKSKNRELNKRSLLKSKSQLESGGILIYAPAGETSYLRKESGKLGIFDAPWFDTPFKLAKSTGAQILPVHISGRNTLAFYFLRLFGRGVGRFFLFWEYLFAKNKPVKITARAPFSSEVVNSTPLLQLKEQVYNSIYELK